MKYYSILVDAKENRGRLVATLESMGVECKWAGVFHKASGKFDAVRASITDEQLVVLKLAISGLEIHEVFK